MNANIKITYRNKEGNEIFNPTEGQMSYSPETKQIYRFSEKGEWEIVKTEGAGLNLNMYDLNKQIISQLPDLNDEQIDETTNTIQNYLEETDNKFYMLLCRDINYYTLFNINTPFSEPKACNEVIACVAELGAVKSIEKNEDNAIEIWVQPKDQDPMVMFLFPYDGGVIECAL